MGWSTRGCACSQAVLTVWACLQWPQWPGQQVMLEQDTQLMAEAGSECGNYITFAFLTWRFCSAGLCCMTLLLESIWPLEANRPAGSWQGLH